MSIQSEIARITQNIAAAYNALTAKGATLPAVQNSDNLAAAIESLTVGSVGYTNLLPRSIKADGTPYVGANGEKGYNPNFRVSSSGVEKAATGYYATGFIPVKAGDTVRIKGMNGTDANGYCVAYYYTSTFAVGASPTYTLLSLSADENNVRTFSPAYTNAAYMRLTFKGNPDDIIITVNEEIAGGRNTEIKKLWENTAHTNAFAAQKVALDLSGYDGVSIYFKNKNNSTVYLSTGIIPIGRDFTLFYMTSDPASQRRAGSVSTTGVTFATGYGGSAESTACAIPVIIYGYKGIT